MMSKHESHVRQQSERQGEAGNLCWKWKENCLRVIRIPWFSLFATDTEKSIADLLSFLSTERSLWTDLDLVTLFFTSSIFFDPNSWWWLEWEKSMQLLENVDIFRVKEKCLWSHSVKSIIVVFYSCFRGGFSSSSRKRADTMRCEERNIRIAFLYSTRSSSAKLTLLFMFDLSSGDFSLLFSYFRTEKTSYSFQWRKRRAAQITHETNDYDFERWFSHLYYRILRNTEYHHKYLNVENSVNGKCIWWSDCQLEFRERLEKKDSGSIFLLKV